MPVVNTTTSLINREPTSLQRLTPGAVARSSILNEKLFSENCETTRILLLLLLGITEYTTSGDVLSLAAMRAHDLCRRLGISDEAFQEVIGQYADFAQVVRQNNPFAF